MFFSGGIDAVHAAYRTLREEGLKTDALTVQGVDYKSYGDEPFRKLIEKVRPISDELFEDSYFVRTDCHELTVKYGVNIKHHQINHIFMLFACGSLYGGYATYRIGADYSLEQQLDVSPYGSNLATNRYIQNGWGDLKTLDTDIARTAKVRYLNEIGVDVERLAVCTINEWQPANCGECAKCSRTKANFMAAIGDIPKMFANMSFDETWHHGFDFRNGSDRAFTGDILTAVEDAGQEDTFPGYAGLKKRFVEDCRRRRYSPLYNYSLTDMAKEELPVSLVTGVQRLKRFLKI